MATSPAPASPVSPLRRSAGRIVGAIVAPLDTFERIAADPHFILCWCLEAVVATAAWLVMVHRIGAVTMAGQTLAQSSRTSSMDPATLQRATAIYANAFHVLGYGVWLTVIAGGLLLALLVLGIANFLLGRNARFKAALGVSVHALLPETLRGLVVILVLALAANPAQMNYMNPLGANLAYFLNSNTTSAFVYALAGHLDIFALWGLALLIIGIASLDAGKKRSFAGAFWVMGSLWFLYVLSTSALRALFS